MGKLRNPLPVKLFIGMLATDSSLFTVCTELLCEKYGPIDYQSAVIPWDKTDYYRNEMGDGIIRQFIFFERLMDPSELPLIKLCTNDIENHFAAPVDNAVRRRINLDPGYITEAKVVLATTKDFSHRIYIGHNIYAEVTLKYNIHDRRYTPCDHTYPDFRTDQYQTAFSTARKLLRTALRQGG
jgi:hypothetical protein